MKLFNRSIESTDPRYCIVRDDPKYHTLKELVEELWMKFRPFADNSFQVDIAHQFHPHFWEMYLGCTFLELGYELIPRETKEGPDLKILSNGKIIWVEATSPNRGSGIDAVPKPVIDQVTQVPKEKVLLRFTNSIYEKNVKLKEYISKSIVKPDDAFVIAINGFFVPFTSVNDEIPTIVKAVLPFGEESVSINLDTLEIIDAKYQYRSEIEKEAGSLVPTTAFQNENFEDISGIIYSDAELWNLPPSFGNDFLFVHNPIAIKEIRHEWLRVGKHYWVEEEILKCKLVT